MRQNVALCGNGLALCQTKKFTPVQIESICRQQNKCDKKFEICSGKGRKHFGKGRKC